MERYDQRMIAIAYLRGWFMIDLLSVFPFEVSVRVSRVLACFPR